MKIITNTRWIRAFWPLTEDAYVLLFVITQNESLCKPRKDFIDPRLKFRKIVKCKYPLGIAQYHITTCFNVLVALPIRRIRLM